MRLVLDTNVLVSAALKRESTPGLAVHLAEGAGALLKSPDTERQLFEVLGRPYLVALIDTEAKNWLRNLMASAEPVTVTERIIACRDPTDDKFLEVAVNGNADVIVSGDSDLLALTPFRDIPILTPAAFVRSRLP
jgi:putative PIN family toxin of toxin-antitoxin system